MSFESNKVRPRTFGCFATARAVFILRLRLLIYSAGSGVKRVQVGLSGFSVSLFCFVRVKTLCRYGCMYFLVALVLVCVDVMVICVGHDLNRYSGWWYVYSVNVE